VAAETGPIPMFPLGTVAFPGLTVPLHVFEDRYRALVHHLLRVPDPEERLFGTVAIREGYEVGEHGQQSLYRVGCRLQITEIESNADGTFDLVAVARDRFMLDRLEIGGPFPVGHVESIVDDQVPVAPEIVERARATFVAYLAAIAPFRGEAYVGDLPRDPEYLSWALAAFAPLPLPERQQLLEAEDSALRLSLVTQLLRAELRAINVIPSLPATEVARTRWSPN
jgi:uncharacterized protein